MQRRSFLRRSLLALPAALLGASRGGRASAEGAPRRAAPEAVREMAADLVVTGGGLGGCAAALAAARHGLRVILTEETDWIGGQLTQQAVPPDENPWIETFGGTRSYLDLRSRIREHYRRNFPLTAEARARWDLNPGNGAVSRLCHEPRAALAALESLLAPFVASARVTILLHHRIVGADVEGEEVRSLMARSLVSGREIGLAAPYFADATELGDLLPLTGTEYVTGFESRRETGEMHAPAEAQPANHQAFTCCFVMDYIEGEDHTIERPRDYGFWRSYVPRLTPAWPGPLLSWVASHPVTLQPRTFEFDPQAAKGLWLYRRIIDRGNFAPGAFQSDMTLVNWPQNDYWLGNLCEVDAAEAARHVDAAKQLSLSLLYWMQTEAPRADGKSGWSGLRLRPDAAGTEDGLAKHPYIREARRIRAGFTVLEQHVGTEARMELTGRKREEVEAERFPDSVGIGSYRIDLHPSSGGDNYIDISSLPFQIPLGALIPRRVRNLIAAAKNIGVTHITNGCYRLHPVEWNIGEAAGVLAALSLRRKRLPREVRASAPLLAELQAVLRRDGVEIAWPRISPR
jgi:hypothetical protein